jgi:hypothetical protein
MGEHEIAKMMVASSPQLSPGLDSGKTPPDTYLRLSFAPRGRINAGGGLNGRS